LNVNNISRISDYVKNINLERNWLQKKKDNLFMPENGENNNSVSELTKQLNDMKKSISLSRIESQMKSGQRLSTADKKYIKEHAPDLYEKAIKIEKERDEYRRALERCKTKEEAAQLHTSRMLLFQAEIRAAKNNPYVDDKDAIDFIGMRANSLSNEYFEFMQDKNEKKYENAVK
jgi:hypothetical protein